MKICTNYFDRLLGLMFKKEIDRPYLFPKCRLIHTFFMRFNIDVIAINKMGVIIKIYRNVRPNKIIWAPRETYSILEAETNSKYIIKQVIEEANYQKN